jgi:D-alanyl-D-alanine carboxypeptidase (penicillin-binding protein 5/6)
MKKTLIALLATAIAGSGFAAAPSIPTPPPVPANGYILVDHDSGRVLAEQRSDERMEPASITKLMTAYLVFAALKEKRLTLTETVKVSEYAWRKGGAVTDEYAKRLGLKGTHYMNSWGGPDKEHYSTARDIATLAHALIRDFPEYYKWYSQKEFTWNKHTQQNRNGLLTKDPTVDGMKTGHTESAKYCLVTSAKRNGMRLISVVLGSPSIKGREDASAVLLNYGYNNYETVKLLDANTTVLTPQVYKGSATSVAVGSRTPISVTVARGKAGEISKEATVKGPLLAPLANGQVVGEYTVRVGDEVVGRIPLVTLAKVDEGGIWRWAVDSVKLWFD